MKRSFIAATIVLLAVGGGLAAALDKAGANLLQAPTSGGGGGGGFVHVRDAFANSGVTNQTSLNVSLSGTASTNLFVLVLTGYNNGFDTGVTATTVSSNNGTACAHATGAFSTPNGGSGQPFADIWYCQNNAASGSVTFQATYTASPGNDANFPSIFVGEFSGAKTSGADAGVGNIFTSASTTSVSVATSGAVPQTNDLVVSVQAPGVAATSIGGSQIDFTSDTLKTASYQISTTGTVTHTYGYGSSTDVAASIAAFEHP